VPYLYLSDSCLSPSSFPTSLAIIFSPGILLALKYNYSYHQNISHFWVVESQSSIIKVIQRAFLKDFLGVHAALGEDAVWNGAFRIALKMISNCI
jgi:hypothetical protein